MNHELAEHHALVGDTVQIVELRVDSEPDPVLVGLAILGLYLLMQLGLRYTPW